MKQNMRSFRIPAPQNGNPNEVGALRVSGTNSNGSGSLAADLRRRATQPYRGSDQLQQALVECEARRRAQADKNAFALATLRMRCKFIVVTVAVLILSGLVVWAGWRLANDGATVVRAYVDRLNSTAK